MIQRVWFLVACALACAGCGDDTTTPEDEGGPSGPKNQGAVQASFRTSSLSTAGKPCNLGVHSLGIGFAHASEVSEIAFITDGEAGSVSCSVSGSGPFDFSADISIDADRITFDASGFPATATELARHPVEVTYLTVQTIETFSSPAATPCTMWLNESQEVAAGRIWFQFECEELETDDRSCGLQQSTAVFQNCAQ